MVTLANKWHCRTGSPYSASSSRWGERWHLGCMKWEQIWCFPDFGWPQHFLWPFCRTGRESTNRWWLYTAPIYWQLYRWVYCAQQRLCHNISPIWMKICVPDAWVLRGAPSQGGSMTFSMWARLAQTLIVWTVNGSDHWIWVSPPLLVQTIQSGSDPSTISAYQTVRSGWNFRRGAGQRGSTRFLLLSVSS